MFFRSLIISEVIFHDLNDKSEVVFRPDDTHEIAVRALTKEEIEISQIYYMSGYAVTLTWERDSTRNAMAVFDALAQRRLPAGIKEEPGDKEFLNERGELAEKYFDEDGGLEIKIPAERFDSAFQIFVESVTSEVYEYLDNFIRILRWRGNGSGPNRPVQRTGGIKWSLDKKAWHWLPEKSRPTKFEHTSMLHTTDEVRSDVEHFVATGIDESLGHELLYEAWHQRTESPRSALILAIAAAEVGLKYCIATLVPNSLWLATNVPSPPIVKMLLDYLPTLPAKCTVNGKVLPPPSELVETLKKGVRLRNQVIHSKTEPLEHDTLREILLAVQSLLWILDYYSGFEWAWEHVDGITKYQMEHPN
ncbi:MAG: hypothetical protein AABM67_00895 [Acidobacteriota bacterium]